MGDEIRNENVTPRGRPALVKPMNSGMDEQEQKGVTVPSRAAMQFAPIPWNRPKIFFVRSGGEVALDIENYENKHSQQHHDLDDIVKEKLNGPADLAAHIKPQTLQQRPDQPIQPFHPKDFVLNEIPYTFYALHLICLAFQ